MQGTQGTLGMITKIPGNTSEDSKEFYCINILGNVQEDYGECSRRFKGLFKKIQSNVQRDPGECSKRFWGMFKRISGECSRRFLGMLE